MKQSLFPPYLVSFVPRATIAIVVLVAMLAIGAFQVGVGITHAADSNSHAPIVIRRDSDFTNCTCVVSGTGSTTNPYIIGPWTINNVRGVAVSIDGTNLTKSFTLLNLTIAGNSMSTDTGIVLNHINPSGTQAISASVKG